MSGIVQLDRDQYRLVVALRYFNVSGAVCTVSDMDKHKIGPPLGEHING